MKERQHRCRFVRARVETRNGKFIQTEKIKVENNNGLVQMDRFNWLSLDRTRAYHSLAWAWKNIGLPSFLCTAQSYYLVAYLNHVLRFRFVFTSTRVHGSNCSIYLSMRQRQRQRQWQPKQRQCIHSIHLLISISLFFCFHFLETQANNMGIHSPMLSVCYTYKYGLKRTKMHRVLAICYMVHMRAPLID